MDKPQQSARIAFETARLRMARARVDGDNARTTGCRLITQNVAHALQVARVGIWFLEDADRLVCRDLFILENGTQTSGQVLESREFPTYMRALRERRAIVADNARQSASTRELGPTYLVPLGITSMLDAPIIREGEVAGVICLEHVGPARTWTAREIDFAGSAADIVALILEQADRAELEALLKVQESQKLETQKLEALGRMARSVAHDFNNVLAVCGLTAEDGASHHCPTCDEGWQGIQEAVQVGHRLSRRLLQVGLRFKDEEESADLGRVLGRLKQSLGALAGARTKVTIDVRESKAVVPFGEGDIEQILLNLVANARDAITEAGKIEIVVRRPGEDEDVAPDYLVLEVKDNGCGMDDRTRGQLFEPYFTTKKNGHGLGLATLYGLLKSHGATISADSARGVGTTFRVAMPRAARR